MTSSSVARRLLVALFQMKQCNEIIELIGVCRRADVSVYSGLSNLQALGRAGLVDPRRLRLTLEGLAVAASLTQASANAEVRFEQLWRVAA
jgi:hypothetical protein